MLHTKFRENRPAGSTVEDFRRIFTIYGGVAHLGHETSIMLSDFHFLVPESFHPNLVQFCTVVSEKIHVEFCMYTTLGQGQEMTLTFNTHISSYILQIFRSLAAIVSEIFTVFTFSY